MEKRRQTPSHTGTVTREYIRALRKRPWLFALLTFSTIALQATLLASPLYLRQIFNTVATGPASSAVLTKLYGYLAILAGLYLAEWIARRVNTATIIGIETRAMVELTMRSFDYLIGHSQQFFSSQFTGTLTRRVRKFYDAFETIFETIMGQFFPTFLFVAGAVVILFTRSHVLGIALAIWVVVMIAIQIWLTRFLQPIRKRRSEAESKVSGALADAIGNQTTIALFAGIPHEKSLFDGILGAWRAATIKAWTADEWTWAIMGLFMTVIEVILIGIAFKLWAAGLLVVGDFLLIQLYLVTTFDNIVSINFTLRRFYNALADASETAEILDEPHGVPDEPGATPLVVAKGTVAFSHVNFGFTDGATVLTDFNLSIKDGKKVALVGPSGAGKSTITKLLLRLYDPDSGTISIDGQDVKQVTQDSLRDAIGFVPQEPILFHRTLMDNIRYGARNATDEQVIEAAKQAHAHEFIISFKDGYETYVGERGVKLSGGERQRVAIARAILKNAPILVLDEATSSLDSESERYIQEALDTLMRGKTVIVIAHRLSTIMKMDRIIVMESGEIVAQGTHEKLLAEHGLYHKLWSIQAGGFLGGEEEDSQQSAESSEQDEEIDNK